MTIQPTWYTYLLILLFPAALFSQDAARPDTISKGVFIEDDPVVYMLDSLANLKFFKDAEYPNANQYQSWNDYSDNDIPYFPDSVYRERIAQMNDESPFEYLYNDDVKKFIELYANKKRKLTSRLLGLAQIYFPLFEEQLDKFNMPLELKYLAVIESALNPTANSRAGAKGLWQFMYGTGKVYGLKVSSYVDDRFDPYKSTIAACEHLNDLYDIYGNWSLALAAYNSGAGNVNKAIRRSGGMKNFWAIQNYLPKETRSYVPAFIAASYVMTYAHEHRINPVDPGILYYEVDTVTVKNPLTFDQIAEMLNVPLDEIAFLNPSFKQGIIPASGDNPYSLRLRKKNIGNFINNENALYAFKTKKGLERDSLMNMVYGSYRETEQHIVKSGETIASIAKRYHMSVAELKSLNNLKKNYVKPKQRILVYTKTSTTKTIHPVSIASIAQEAIKKDSTPEKKLSVSQPVSKESSPVIHVVKSGESLGSIAQKYRCSIDQLMKWNNLNNNKIIIGQKLKINAASKLELTEVKPSTTKSKPVKPSSTSAQKFTFYTIQPGDNLWDIAVKFDVTVSQIKNLNDIKNHNRLKPGQKIKIPQ